MNKKLKESQKLKERERRLLGNNVVKKECMVLYVKF